MEQQLYFPGDKSFPGLLLSGTLIITPNVARRPEYVQSLAQIINKYDARIYINHRFASFIGLVAGNGDKPDGDEKGIVNAFSKWLFRRSYRLLGAMQLRWLRAACIKLWSLIKQFSQDRQGLINLVDTPTRFLKDGLVTARTITEDLLFLIRKVRLDSGPSFRVVDFGCRVKAVLEKHIVVVDVSKICSNKITTWLRGHVPRLRSGNKKQRRVAVLIPISVENIVALSIVALSPVLGDDVSDLLDKTVEVLLQIDP